jgi:hypothetical protein
MKSGLGGLLLTSIPGRRALAQDGQNGAEEPHFFLQIVTPDGLDCSYLFDARPLAMTAAGKQSNYLAEEPTAWEGRNGQTAWATRLVEPLRPFRERFTVLNGVVMAATFDGHDQNMNYLFTGSPFGGESFIPHLNEPSASHEAAPLDYVQTGFLFPDVTNGGASMPLFPGAAYSLVNRMRAATPVDPASPLERFITSRMTANAGGPGRFSKAAGLMAAAEAKAPALGERLRSLQVNAPSNDALADDLQTVTQLFKADITRGAVITIRPVGGNLVDTHTPEQAAQSATLIGSVATQVAAVFDALQRTPYDDHRSMLDMTTVVCASEFTRTMRQRDLAIDATGTDHNSLSNMVLIGGKGIKGGLVVGESDSRTADEEISPAHRAFDPDHLKVMGRPFDAATLQASRALPEVYHAGDYLSFAMVANTVYQLFGVDRRHYWVTERGGDVARVMPGLLS